MTKEKQYLYIISGYRCLKKDLITAGIRTSRRWMMIIDKKKDDKIFKLIKKKYMKKK